VVLFLILFFILGTAVGSFLNVVIDRTTQGQSILGRSYCDYCRATLGVVDLIPILSFTALSGRCRHCRKKLSWQYPIVETVTGLLFVRSFLILTVSGQLTITTLLYYFFLISILIVVAVVDFKFSLVPTTLVFLASLLALFYNYFFLTSGQFVQSVAAAFGTAVFFLVIVILTRGRGMGEGDVVLGFLIGMVLGLKESVLAIFLAFLIGAIISLFLITLGKKHFGQTVPFAPFLSLGFLISLFWAKEIINWYLMLY